MGKFDLPEEQACPRCNGSGTVEVQAGSAYASQVPTWSRDYGRAKCGRCEGRGYLLRTKSREYGSSVTTLLEKAQADTLDQAAEEAYALPTIVLDPEAKKRREIALNCAMAAFQMSGGPRGMFGGGGTPEMDANEIVPLAREVEFFLRGD